MLTPSLVYFYFRLRCSTRLPTYCLGPTQQLLGDFQWLLYLEEFPTYVGLHVTGRNALLSFDCVQLVHWPIHGATSTHSFAIFWFSFAWGHHFRHHSLNIMLLLTRLSLCSVDKSMFGYTNVGSIGALLQWIVLLLFMFSCHFKVT